MARDESIAPDDERARTVARTESPVDRSRLGVYAALGGTVSALPLPWLPDSLVRRVRGALVQDVAMRHGLSLSREARVALSEPAGSEGPRSLLQQALRFAGGRIAVRALARVGPLAAVWTARDALRTYALGHLFDRYLEAGRTTRAVRIDGEEARRVRRAIDGALAHALTIDAPPPMDPAPIDDQRDPLTALLDGLLSFAAGVPSWLVHRLDSAFDDLLDHARG